MDGKRLDGAIYNGAVEGWQGAGVGRHLCRHSSPLVSWKGGRVLVWDVTCVDTLAPSHRQLASREAGAVAASAEQRKNAHLEATHHFVPIAVETLGVVGEEGSIFFKDLGRRIADVTQEQQSHQFLLQRVSITVQRGNVASILGTLVQGERSVVM